MSTKPNTHGSKLHMLQPCAHTDSVHTTSVNQRVCEDCVRIGSRWVHLRMCLSCGHTGCCDSSPNKHATKHFHQSGHPLVRSAEPGEGWVWCYVDEAAVGEVDG